MKDKYQPFSLHSSGGFAFFASRGSNQDVVFVLWLERREMEQKGKRDEEEERRMRLLQTATVNYHTEEMRETEMKSLETSSLNEGEKKKV